jgi:MFS family permease
MMLDHAPSEKYFGTFLSILFFASTIAMIIGPICGGWLVGLFNNDYSVIWPVMAVFFALALLFLNFVTSGEVKQEPELEEKLNTVTETA